MPHPRSGRVALFRADIRGTRAEGSGHLLNDALNGDRQGAIVAKNVFNRVLCGSGVLRRAVNGHKRLHFFNGTFELTNVVLKPFGNVLHHIVGKFKLQQLCLAFDDGHARFQVRRLNIGQQAPFKASA
ncbi:hypothetical protein SDC9_204199 [bioreactor metagenome]|uniref:Uncharacterized protein n=1 Tax=bioreactor metagenome TaxID=1076179 RepID=A0A645J1C6_9ZZZZ